MGDKTAIEWTDATWNPTVGCSIVSKGCTNCYAMKLAARLARTGNPAYHGLTKSTKAGPVWAGDVRLNPDVLTKPLSWRRPRRIFVNSMSDLFHEALPDEAIDQVFAVMALCPQHAFQVLTKRPERMRDYLRAPGLIERLLQTAMRLDSFEGAIWNTEYQFGHEDDGLPLFNVWLGVSVEDQATADARIPILLDTPAAKRFISAEPLLGPVDLSMADHGHDALTRECWGDCWNCKKGYPPAQGCRREHDTSKHVAGLDWVIAGGESGPEARPAHPDWFRALRDQCAGAGVPYFFKQWGEHIPAELEEQPGAGGEPWRRYHDGHRCWILGELGKPRAALEPIRYMRVGKKAAGALLDGREHREFPR